MSRPVCVSPGPQTCLVRFAVPVVTTLQLLADMALANTTPPGYRHVFAADDYMDAWLAALELEGWTGGKVARLETLYASDR